MEDRGRRDLWIAFGLAELAAAVVWLAGGSTDTAQTIGLLVFGPLAFISARKIRRQRERRQRLRHSGTVGDYVQTDVGVWTKDGFVPEKKYVPPPLAPDVQKNGDIFF